MTKRECRRKARGAAETRLSGEIRRNPTIEFFPNHEADGANNHQFPAISNDFQSIPITFIKIMGDETRSGKGSCQGCRSCAADWDNPRSVGTGMRQRQKMSRLKVSAARTNRAAARPCPPAVGQCRSKSLRTGACRKQLGFRRFPEISNQFQSLFKK